MTEIPGVDPAVPPSGAGCVECEAAAGWWLHLRRCTQCGHIGCCDHLAVPAREQACQGDRPPGDPQLRAGGELVLVLPGDGFWEQGPALAGPECHPEEQTVPGPHDRVPHDWRSRLNP